MSKEAVDDIGVMAALLVMVSIFQWWNAPPEPEKPAKPDPEQVLVLWWTGSTEIIQEKKLKFAADRLYVQAAHTWVELLPGGEIDYGRTGARTWKPMTEKTKNYFNRKPGESHVATNKSGN